MGILSNIFGSGKPKRKRKPSGNKPRNYYGKREKEWRYIDFESTRAEANDRAKYMRQRGMPVKITKSGSKYKIWAKVLDK